MANWVNLGDVIPLVHGGLWIKDVGSDFPGNYQIVELAIDDDNDAFVVMDGYVDVNDNWIDWEKVKNYYGDFKDDFNKAVAVYSYYGYVNFQGERKIFYNEMEVIDEIRSWEISIG